MEQIKRYRITGLKPIDTRVNAIIKALDLGTEGAFIGGCTEVTVTLSQDVTEKQVELIPEKLGEVFEAIGWIKVKVEKVKNGSP